MRRDKYIFFICCIIFIASSCVDEIDLNINTEQRSLVVDGIITDSLNYNSLKISLSSVIGIGNDNILDPVSNATVNLMNSNGDSYPYIEVSDGKYEVAHAAERGIEYYIDIVLENGKHYQSRPASLRSSSTIDSLKWGVVDGSYVNTAGQFIEESLLNINGFISVPSGADRPYLRWRVEGMFEFVESFPGLLNPKHCFIPDKLDISNIKIFDTNELNGNVLFDQQIVQTPYNYRFIAQYSMLISQFAMTEEEYLFWESIEEITNIEGGLFDPPPGTVKGNVFNVDDPDEFVAGYFSISSLAQTRYFISQNSTGFSIPRYCWNFSWWPSPFGCDDCTKILNSSLEKPDYWP